jgi:phosphohistidine phosphatase
MKPERNDMKTKTLFLIRHAKSDRSEAGLPDHDRPLNDRGRRDAREMGRRLKQRGVKPDLILASTALRARTTALLLAAELDLGADSLVEDQRIYASSATKLMYVVQELDDKLACVILVGHNPEMTELAQHFSQEAPDMPTCAVAQFTFAVDAWSGIGAAAPAGVAFDSPKKGRD